MGERFIIHNIGQVWNLPLQWIQILLGVDHRAELYLSIPITEFLGDCFRLENGLESDPSTNLH